MHDPSKFPPLKPGDIYPSHILRDVYGMNAANRPLISVDEREVPDHLKPLIPYVERWAIPCDVTRLDYFDKQPEQDVSDFWFAIKPHQEAVNAWLNEQPQDVLTWPAAAVQFMYMLKAHADAFQPTEEEKKQWAIRDEAHRQKMAREKALESAQIAFKEKRYAAVVELLTPFADDLSTVDRTKLTYSKKHCAGATNPS